MIDSTQLLFNPEWNESISTRLAPASSQSLSQVPLPGRVCGISPEIGVAGWLYGVRCRRSSLSPDSVVTVSHQQPLQHKRDRSPFFFPAHGKQ